MCAVMQNYMPIGATVAEMYAILDFFSSLVKRFALLLVSSFGFDDLYNFTKYGADSRKVQLA